MSDHLRPRSGRSRRAVEVRNTRRRFLILCEGKKTEKLYFEAFRVPKSVAEIVGVGDNTLSLVRKAISLRDKYLQRGESFDEVWCVFDRDSFPPGQFNAALDLALNEGM